MGSCRPRLGRGHGRHHHAGAGPRPCHQCPGQGSRQPSAPSACRPPHCGHCRTQPAGLGSTVSTRQPHLTARTQEWVLPDRNWLSSPTVPPYTWLCHHRSHCSSSCFGDILLSRTLCLCNPSHPSPKQLHKGICVRPPSLAEGKGFHLPSTSTASLKPKERHRNKRGLCQYPTIPLTANYGTEDKDKVISFASSFGINHSASGLHHRDWLHHCPRQLSTETNRSASGTPNLPGTLGLQLP